MKYEVIYKLNGLRTLKECKDYLKDIEKEYNSIELKKDKNKFLKMLNEFALGVFVNMNFNLFDGFDIDKNGEIVEVKRHNYKVHNTSESIKYILSNNLANINSKNYDFIMEELNGFYDSLRSKHNTKRISEKEIDGVFEVLYQKYPKLEKIFDYVKLNIILYDYTSKEFNSSSTTSFDFKDFIINCFYIRKEIYEKEDGTNPIYIFLHELGHVICWLYTKRLASIPMDFLKEVKFFKIEYDNPDALDVFADAFAMSLMHNTTLSAKDPFKKFVFEEDYKVLEKYFEKIIKKIWNDINENSF